MRDVIFLNIFIMAVLGALRESGALEALTVSITKFATTVKRAELSIFALVTFLYPLVSLNTPAILFAGPVCKEIGLKLNIHRSRRANLMDLAGNGITGNLPHINTILALAAAMMASHDAVGAPIVPITTIGLFTFHPIMLTLVALFAIATGWGHKKG
jgi:Na+/H+ antiporter NhaC